VRALGGFVVAVAVAFAASVVLGEYKLTVISALVAAVAVPVAVGESLAWVAGVRDRWWQHALTAALAGGALAWGTWLSDGRGLQPWPAAGWLAVAGGTAWPAALALRAARRSSPTTASPGPT
jgi:hypothetical protein